MKFDLAVYLTELEYIVNIDSGSKCLEGVAKVGEYFALKIYYYFREYFVVIKSLICDIVL